jgi:hypothetical protein
MAPRVAGNVDGPPDISQRSVPIYAAFIAMLKGSFKFDRSSSSQRAGKRCAYNGASLQFAQGPRAGRGAPTTRRR